MKNGKQAILAVTFAFICLLAGIFIGRNTGACQLAAPETHIVKNDVSDNDVSSTENVNTEVGKININSATASQLTLLPGIGEKLAQRIIDYRMSNGNFDSIDDLLNVEGIGQKKLDTIRQYLTLGG